MDYIRLDHAQDIKRTLLRDSRSHEEVGHTT